MSKAFTTVFGQTVARLGPVQDLPAYCYCIVYKFTCTSRSRLLSARVYIVIVLFTNLLVPVGLGY